MPRVNLTDRGVRSLATAKVQEDFYDTVQPGLILRVSAAGGKVWSVRYKAGGAKRRLKLGAYPTLTLAAARDAARDAIRGAGKGEDPAQERKDWREGVNTFGAMAEEVLEGRKDRTRERTQKERRRLLDREILPAWKSREVSSISRRDVVQLVEAIARRGTPVLANRTLSLIHLLFNDGLRRGFPTLEANPAHLVEPPGKEGGRDRYLSGTEIAALWRLLEDETAGTRGAFRLALLTAQRIGSVLAMRWDEIEENGSGALWSIPEESFKGKRPHLVPLSPEARAVLAELRKTAGESEYVFPSRAGSKLPHLGNLTSTSLARVRRAAGIPHWTLHDFRTTFRTWSTRSTKEGGLGIPGHVADAVLGHKEATLGFGRYTGDKDRYLLEEKRDALRRWGRWIGKEVGR